MWLTSHWTSPLELWEKVGRIWKCTSCEWQWLLTNMNMNMNEYIPNVVRWLFQVFGSYCRTPHAKRLLFQNIGCVSSWSARSQGSVGWETPKTKCTFRRSYVSSWEASHLGKGKKETWFNSLEITLFQGFRQKLAPYKRLIHDIHMLTNQTEKQIDSDWSWPTYPTWVLWKITSRQN